MNYHPHIFNRAAETMLNDVICRYLDKFGRQWSKKLWKFRIGAKCTKFLDFVSIINHLR